jgi:uncharacterized protein (DUF302 family)
MGRWGRYAVNTLAVLGAAFTILVGVLFYRGWSVGQQLDPKASVVFGEFARRILHADAASASVVKLAVAPGVSMKEAGQSMELRANARNIKRVARLPYYKEVESQTGDTYPYLEIFQFCDAVTAAALLDYNRDFAAYMPCSIALYEDTSGQGWLVTMNLDFLIHGGRELEPELKQKVLDIKEALLDIMAAGATGAL